MLAVKELYQLVNYNVIDKQTLETNRKKPTHHQVKRVFDFATFSRSGSVIPNSL